MGWIDGEVLVEVAYYKLHLPDRSASTVLLHVDDDDEERELSSLPVLLLGLYVHIGMADKLNDLDAPHCNNLSPGEINGYAKL